jgi:uncharacterized protein YbjT (DUF2867 family)
MNPPERSALVAGATGLVGRALLAQLLADAHYGTVHVLARRVMAAPSARTRVHVADFDALTALPAVDDVYVCLGTTIRLAGSQAAFRRVDHDYVVKVARLAHEAGASRLAVVSAMGANARSRIFYNRVKGEMEAAVAQLGYDSVTIVRPSFLTGDRAALDQPERPGERWALAASRALRPLLAASIHPVSADAVARAMLGQTLRGEPGMRVLTSDLLQRYAV